jgi:serine/threonine protein kinase/Tfp pilus assembly protein PilF
MFSTGDVISHYEIVERLGGGGMGVVFRARDLKLKRDVALKFLPAELSLDEDANARFVTEAQAASALEHPHICNIHEIGELEDGRLFIAMALYEGRTLKKILQDAGEGGLNVDRALDLVCQIADGLAAAHEKGIIHRDIKPANIMVDERGRAIILDFGLAKLSGAVTITRTGSTVGTIAYMSPEQARGSQVGAASDVWALGAVFHELLTGHRPFAGDYDQAVVYNILNTDPPRACDVNPDIQPDIQSVLDRMLSKDLSVRYPSAIELSADLNEIAAGRSPSAVSLKANRLSDTRKAGSSWLRARWISVVAAVAVSVLALVLIGQWLRTSQRTIDSIAVLPLTDLSGADDQEYFADGMTEALITELSKISALKVISRQSVMRFKNSDLPLKSIASELGVAVMVAGSVIRSGDRVRVTAQLISSESEENLWADRFDRNLEDILVLYADVARAIAAEIEVTVTPAEQARLAVSRTVDPEAYEEYLKGQFHFARLSSANFEDALGYYERALEIDPDFALAYAGIARVWGGAALWGGVSPGEANARAIEAIRKAVALGDTLGETMQNLAVQEFGHSYDWEAAERAFQRALAINPNYAPSHSIYADFLGCMQRFDEALEHTEQAAAIDPLSAFTLGLQAWVLLAADRYAESIERHHAALRSDPNFPLALRGMWALNRLEGDSSASLSAAAAFYMVQGLPEVAAALETGFADGGYGYAMTLGAREAVAVAGQRYVYPMHIARLFTFAGDRDRAVDLLEQAYAERFPSMPALGVDLHWDSLRDDPRFEALMRKMNLPS